MEDQDFKPTKKDLINIESLILDIKAKKNSLVDRKMKMEHSISTMPDSKQRKEIKKILHQVELDIRACNEELKYKNKVKVEAEYYINNTRQPNDELDKLILKLNSLKTKYSEFAKDRTRVASLRVMANEFITEIDNLLKLK